ncbi:hypothetical protein M5K25_024473 [Dendrobium thyrsiflorum]|uniref:Uncharacterized protein n=1 Tax=Dendrobium thyrsiflorum TaxID=117978 RepID=A0ABD0U2B9_DENTH
MWIGALAIKASSHTEEGKGMEVEGCRRISKAGVCKREEELSKEQVRNCSVNRAIHQRDLREATNNQPDFGRFAQGSEQNVRGGIMAGRKVKVLEGEIGQLKSDFEEKISDFQNQFVSIHEKMDGRFTALEDMMKKMLEDKQKPATSESKETTGGHGKGGNLNPFRGEIRKWRSSREMMECLLQNQFVGRR